MKVRELIDELEDLPENASIRIESGHYKYDISDVVLGDGWEWDKDEVIIIEGSQVH